MYRVCLSYFIRVPYFMINPAPYYLIKANPYLLIENQSLKDDKGDYRNDPF